MNVKKNALESQVYPTFQTEVDPEKNNKKPLHCCSLRQS